MSQRQTHRHAHDPMTTVSQRSARASQRSAEILEQVQRRRADMAAKLQARRGGDSARQNGQADQAPSQQSGDQMHRKHVLIVNTDPEFLDAARVILQRGDFNVTTTNLLPSTYQMIDAVGVDAIVIDVALGQPQIWSLVDQLRKGVTTRSLPIVFTATNPALLDEAAAQPWRAGGRYVFLKPFDPDDLQDAIQSLIGEA